MGIPNDSKIGKQMSSLGTIFITGSNRGIGLEFVKQYSLDNWDVIATCRDTSQAKELIELSEHNNNLSLMDLDITKKEVKVTGVASNIRGTTANLKKGDVLTVE